jgi:hypothetical protein
MKIEKAEIQRVLWCALGASPEDGIDAKRSVQQKE